MRAAHAKDVANDAATKDAPPDRPADIHCSRHDTAHTGTHDSRTRYASRGSRDLQPELHRVLVKESEELGGFVDEVFRFMGRVEVVVVDE